jgi:hypothetical protein
MSEQERRRPKAVWGAKGIGGHLNLKERRAFDLLERGVIPARKIGPIWQSTDIELDDFMLGGRQPASEREDA